MAAACDFSRMAAASLARALIPLGAFALAACGSTEPAQPDTASSATTSADSSVAQTSADQFAMVPPVDPADPSTCNAPAAQPFIGREADQAARSELAAAVAPITTIRWVAPGDATTEDLRPERLNVILDLEGAIAAVHCG